jgi:penicillin-binding protein 1C
MRKAVWIAGVLLAPWVVLFVTAALTPLPAELGGDLRGVGRFAASVRVLDRTGALLREVRADDGCRARYVKLDEVGERAQKAMLAAEDRRFFLHPGVDPFAVLRAVGQAVWHRRVVSGASTLTQQLARTVVPRPRNAWGKFREMALALRIGWSLSKREILEQYLNRVAFGPGLRGIEAASHFYFDKPTRDLSLAEAALLSGMPRGPSLYDPTKGTVRVERRRNRILARLLSNGQATGDEVRRAQSEPIALAKGVGGLGAPHFVRALLQGTIDPSVRGSGSLPGEITTTLDARLQREAEVLAQGTVKSLSRRHVTAASVIVLDNVTGEILAYVGSPDFGDADHLGENDGVLAQRQPGSALKPFIYELALEKLGFTAATVLPDIDLHLEHNGVDYHPQNYDGRYHGPVRLREALANSYNVPAVYTASLLGAGQVLERLQQIGFTSLDHDAAFYGPAIALGDGEVRLIELAGAYAALARGGTALPVRGVLHASKSESPSLPSVPAAPVVMRKEETRVISDILSDRNARIGSFGSESPLDLPFPASVKTGTSKGFRDNWTVGYTPEITVAVWVGNFDGSPMHGVSGVTGAGPLFRDVMIAAIRAHPSSPGAGGPELDTVEICPLSGALPAPSCPHRHRESFVHGTAPHATCNMHETVHIDVRNGLRAGPGCPIKFVEDRSYEAFDSTYASWAKASVRPLASETFSPLCPGRSAPGDQRGDRSDVMAQAATRLTFPLDGATFVYDDGASSRQMLTLRALAPGSAMHVRFYVDGRLLASTRAPFLADWLLTRGVHRVRAESDVGQPSEPIELTVQ